MQKMMIAGNSSTKLSAVATRGYRLLSPSQVIRSSSTISSTMVATTTMPSLAFGGKRQERDMLNHYGNRNYHLVQPINKRIVSNLTTRHQSMTTSTESVEYLCVHVFVTCKAGTEEAFLEASLANARESSKEEGIARFDVVQQIDDPTKFVLVEVYKNGDAPAAHKETAHYLKWRETVADMMAEPRSALKFKNHFPAVSGGWDYPEGAKLE
mmetsp:Transcript_63543/g.94286  ORF Transcript_63543/g.94286 Transcript_63543/m.94286 type:complete len:211 (-) Transcript_63543:239-871(-)